MTTNDTLARAVRAARETLAARRDRESLRALEKRSASVVPRGYKFVAAISRGGTTNVIAECKRRSPSRGTLIEDYRPAVLARSYERGGAAAVSVLTEPLLFGGSIEDLTAVRQTIQAPILRKDFTVDEYQLFEARAAGADAVLLIVAALDATSLRRLHALALDLGLAALVEVHDARELALALACGARAVGVNNRNLRSLSVDLDASRQLATSIPTNVIAVSESGISSRSEIEALRALGYRAFLVGERLATDPDPARAVAELVASGPQPFLKVCGVTRLEDALIAAEHGATAIGFVFWPNSPRYIPPERAREIIAELPLRVTPVGVFVNESPDDIRAAVKRSGVRAVQLHGDESPALSDAIPQRVLRSATLENADATVATWPAHATLLLDAGDKERRGGTGRVIDWERAAAIARRRATVLAGGLTPVNVAEAIRITRPFGVDVSSGVEAAPGVKDAGKVSLFLENARAAFERL